jgi:DNA polymerase-3 subunit epsilon
MARDLLDSKPLFLDTETTGLGDRDEIIEIGLIDHDGTVLVESFVRPMGMVPPDATAIHGITTAMLRDAPAWPAIWPHVRALLTSRRVAVYNASYDLRLLQQTHRKHRMSWDPPEKARFDCLMEMYAQYRGEWDRAKRGYRWHSLSDAGRQAQILQANTHRAVDDARLARALLEHLAAQPG